MKEAMFEGPEVLDKMLEDADIANFGVTPDEIVEHIDAKDDSDEINNIIKEFEQPPSNAADGTIEPHDEMEDSNNNVCSVQKTEPIQNDEGSKEKHI